ncbi:hypothetical protein P9139_09560 [Curtobacterium flaccumfaciens]|nr:hypothetical protein P9139_09560 [Curtobacterium flaccumfaciens]
MAAGTGDDDDVYATSDAAWLTEEADADTEDDDATEAQDADDDDMGTGMRTTPPLRTR